MTDQQPRQQQYPRDCPPYEDEINLIDYLRVLWKWKWFIMAGTLIAAIIAAVISFQMPKFYEISTVIKPGVAGIKDDGGFIYIDSVANISGTINEGIYKRRIEEALHLDPLKTWVNFKSVVVRNTKLIKITSRCEEEDIVFGMKAINRLLRFLSDDGQYIEQKKTDHGMQLYTKQYELKQIETRREFLKDALKNTKRRMERLNKEADSVKINTRNLTKQRDLLLKKGKTEDEMSFLLYSTTIQQNLTYLNQVSNQIFNLIEREKEALREIEDIKGNIDIIKAEIASLNNIKEMISGIAVIQEPEVSLHPVKSKKKQIILLSVVVGLFFMIFLVFFIEYIKNASKPSSGDKGR